MHINKVHASAFGPLRGQSLDLTPGLNIVHGPNEAGKSSWFAAAYAGLAGRRRQRGRGTAAQAEFTQRHRPWSGSQWAAGVTITLDSGLVLAIENDLSRGESRIVDSSTRRAVSPLDLARRLGITLTTDSTLDGTRIVGLNRDTARATIFTGQADILRVLEDAAELQEFLERAASSGAADTTADGALSWLTERRSVLVGSESVGNRPLRASRLALDTARDETTGQRDKLVKLFEVLRNKQQIGVQLEQAKQDVELAERFALWQEVHKLQARVEQATRMSTEELAEAGSPSPVDENKIQRGASILSVYTASREVSPLPAGPSAADLQAEIDGLPDRPEGDLEPRSDVVDAYQVLSQAQTALMTHRETAPGDELETADAKLTPDDLRALAETLDEAEPITDPALRAELEALQRADIDAASAYRDARVAFEEATNRNNATLRDHAEAVERHAQALADYERARSEQDARREEARSESGQGAPRPRWALALAAAGLVVLIIGIVLLASGQKLPGLVAAIAGLLVGVGAFIAPRAARPEPWHQPAASDDVGAPPPPPVPPRLEEVQPPVPPDPNPRVTDLQVAIRSQDQMGRAHAERINSARETLRAHGLDPDPAALRQLARAIDDAEAARERHRAHSEQAALLRSARDSSATKLAGALGTGISADVTDDTVRELNDAFAAYAGACRERANLARQADRRTDLLAALEQRKGTEAQHTAAVAEREAQTTALISFVTDLGKTPESAAEAAELLRQWLDSQEQARRDQNHRDQLAARLDQTLGGRDLAQLRAALDTLVGSAGPDPGELPGDIETFKANARQRHSALVESLGQLGGRQQELGSALGSVAAAVEREAEAERQMMRIELLASCIDTAAAQLRTAKERANASIAPAIQARVRQWLPKVTNGRYLDVEVDPTDLRMKVTEASGAIRHAHLLSQGTTEQLFLLLRVALAQTLSGQSEMAPLILDDVTVQSDRQRTTAILEMLRILSEERQVVLFTQEDEVADWARSNLQNERDQFLSLPAPQ